MVIYVVVLVHTANGSNYEFVNKTAGTLLVYAVIATIYCVFGYLYFEHVDMIVYAWLEHVGFGVSAACFAVAHWWLAEMYDHVGRDMPYVLEGIEPPEDKCCSRGTKNALLTSLNAGLTILREVIRAIIYKDPENFMILLVILNIV